MYDNNDNRFMSQINVTPLVDVMLVLLIIFMVTAPMMIQGVTVNLPQTTSKYLKNDKDPLIISINKNKKIFLENHRIKLNRLELKIKKIFENRDEKGILLRADKEVPYGFVIQVMSKIKGAGIEQLGMVTEPLD